MSGKDARSHGIRGRLVRIAFLVRLLAIGYCLLSLSVYGAKPAVMAVVVLLLLTSHLGLQYPAVRGLVVRHPFLALVDLVPVAVAPLLVGTDTPLSLVALISALLVGVLFPLRTVVPLAALLVALDVLAQDGSADMVSVLPNPVVMLTLVALGYAVRRLAEQNSEADHERALALQAAAAAHERLRLARDLHDTVAKSVQGVALTATALPAWMDRDPQVARRLAASIAEGAGAAVAAARNLLGSLRLDDPERPLAEVIDELVYRWEAEHDRVATREIGDVDDLPPGHRHELVLALSEALENVRRHAPDAAVRVLLAQHDTTVRLTLADAGPGIPEGREDAARADGHFGLTGIRERMAYVGGSATIRSAPGSGTEVVLEVPREPVPEQPAPSVIDLRAVEGVLAEAAGGRGLTGTTGRSA